jgi:EmrB/QacA subfamily drug resistance transporter
MERDAIDPTIDSRPRGIVVEYPGGEEVPVVAWPMLLRERLRRRVDHGDRYRWWVLWTVLVGLFASGFTITILAVSLADVAADLGASETSLTWTVTGPFLALAVTMPLFGKIGDVFGHRRVYLYGLAGFTLGTFLTALAWDGGSLIGIRVLGAIPGAATGPASMALIMRAFPEEDRVKAMGWWSLVGAGAPVIGLVAGGPLVDALGWRTIFFIQAPLALLALVVAVPVLHETPRTEREPIDFAGAIVLAIAIVAPLLALTIGDESGWTEPLVLALFALGPAGAVAFVAVERRALHPLLPLDFFRRRNFDASLMAQFFSNFAYMGGFIVTPILMEKIFGFSVAETSLAMVCRPLSFSLSAPAAGYVAVRVGERAASVFGTALVVVSMVCFALAATTESLGFVFAALLLSGLGLGSSQPSLISSAANAVEPERLGVANAAQVMVTQIGVVTGIQVLSTIQGGAADVSSFTTAYLLGAAIAVVGVIGATFVRSADRTVTLRVADAA